MAGGVCVAGGSVHGRGHAWWWWWGACMAGGCMAGGHVAGGMHGRGACMVGGHVWQGVCMAGRHAWWGGMRGRYYEIRSMSGRYASYWDAFLFVDKIELVLVVCIIKLLFSLLQSYQCTAENLSTKLCVVEI